MGWVLNIMPRPQQALFLRGGCQKEDRAAWCLRCRTKGTGKLDEAGDTNRVVSRPVEDLIPLTLGIPPQMIPMSGIDHELVRGGRIGSGKHSQDVA